MIDPIIIKLTQTNTPFENPLEDDVRIGLEILKGKYHPDISEELKDYLWHNVRHDVLKEYFVDNLDDESPNGIDNWKIEWK